VIIDGGGVRLSRDQKQEKENPGSDDRDLRSPEGNAARYVLRHSQFPYREDTSLNLPVQQETAPTTLAVDEKASCPATTVRCVRWPRNR
jgi:hypothetical protein